MLLLILDVIKSPSKITFSNTVAKISFCPEMSVGISLSQIGQMQNKIYNNKRFIICIAFASLIVLGTSAIIWTCSSITLIISISILCFLQASSIDTLQKTFNFSFSSFCIDISAWVVCAFYLLRRSCCYVCTF